MNKEKIIRYQAHSLLLQYRIQTVTLDNLVYIIEDQGYEIVEYGSEDFESQHLFGWWHIRYLWSNAQHDIKRPKNHRWIS